MPAAFQPLHTTISKSINTGADLLLEKLGQNCTGSSFMEDSLHNTPRPPTPPPPRLAQKTSSFMSFHFKKDVSVINHLSANPTFPRRHEKMTILLKKFQKD